MKRHKTASGHLIEKIEYRMAPKMDLCGTPQTGTEEPLLTDTRTCRGQEGIT